MTNINTDSTINMETMRTFYRTSLSDAHMEVVQAEQRLFKAESEFSVAYNWLAEWQERRDNPQPTITEAEVRRMIERMGKRA